jgi:hypothetical protein
VDTGRPDENRAQPGDAAFAAPPGCALFDRTILKTLAALASGKILAALAPGKTFTVLAPGFRVYFTSTKSPV